MNNTQMLHWTINGEIIQEEIFNIPVTTCYLANIPEWIEDHILLTGHADGSINVWKLDDPICESKGNCSEHKHLARFLRKGMYHESPVTCIYLPNDYSYVIIGYQDGTIQKLN